MIILIQNTEIVKQELSSGNDGVDDKDSTHPKDKVDNLTLTDLKNSLIYQLKLPDRLLYDNTTIRFEKNTTTGWPIIDIEKLSFVVSRESNDSIYYNMKKMLKDSCNDDFKIANPDVLSNLQKSSSSTNHLIKNKTFILKMKKSQNSLTSYHSEKYRYRRVIFYESLFDEYIFKCVDTCQTFTVSKKYKSLSDENVSKNFGKFRQHFDCDFKNFSLYHMSERLERIPALAESIQVIGANTNPEKHNYLFQYLKVVLEVQCKFDNLAKEQQKQRQKGGFSDQNKNKTINSRKPYTLIFKATSKCIQSEFSKTLKIEFMDIFKNQIDLTDFTDNFHFNAIVSPSLTSTFQPVLPKIPIFINKADYLPAFPAQKSLFDFNFPLATIEDLSNRPDLKSTFPKSTIIECCFSSEEYKQEQKGEDINYIHILSQESLKSYENLSISLDTYFSKRPDTPMDFEADEHPHQVHEPISFEPQDDLGDTNLSTNLNESAYQTNNSSFSSSNLNFKAKEKDNLFLIFPSLELANIDKFAPLACFRKGSWYRCEFLKVLGQQSEKQKQSKQLKDCEVLVRFVDFGDCQIVKYKNLRFLPKRFIENYPPFAYNCKYINTSYTKERIHRKVCFDETGRRISYNKEPANLTHFSVKMVIYEFNNVDKKWIIEPISVSRKT